jgi:hypothetical protein
MITEAVFLCLDLFAIAVLAAALIYAHVLTHREIVLRAVEKEREKIIGYIDQYSERSRMQTGVIPPAYALDLVADSIKACHHLEVEVSK